MYMYIIIILLKEATKNKKKIAYTYKMPLKSYLSRSQRNINKRFIEKILTTRHFKGKCH